MINKCLLQLQLSAVKTHRISATKNARTRIHTHANFVFSYAQRHDKPTILYYLYQLLLPCLNN